MASWASIVSSGTPQPNAGEDQVSVEEVQAAESLICSDRLVLVDDSDQPQAARWQHGLVGRFASGSQLTELIKRILIYHWVQEVRNF